MHTDHKTERWQHLWSLLLLLCAVPIANKAQTYTMGNEKWATWDDFLEFYMPYLTENNEEDADNRWNDEVIHRLEDIKNAPINLNTADRESLLELPFLHPAQVDAILQYRAKKRLFYSLGELQFVRNLTHETRRFLSLFVYAGDTIAQKTPWQQRYFSGKHELHTRIDIPLYKRAGNKSAAEEEITATSNNIYLGNGIANIIRYRYKWQQNIAYGITLEKDAGEPFFSNGNYPYDYSSFYFYSRIKNGRHAFWIGDYNVCWAQGLVMGGNYFSGRLQAVENSLRSGKEIRPHTSANEYNFLRGVAAKFRLKNKWELSLFTSYKKMDARMSDDVITSFKTDGLHRTPNEMHTRRNVSNSTTGVRVSYQQHQWQIGAGAVYSHFSREICPSPRIYNTYYLRGKEAAAAEIDYSWNSDKWALQGEAAIDKAGHPSITNTIKYAASQHYSFTLQQRSFSPRFVSPFGNTLQAGSHVANEHGLLFGCHLQPLDRLTITAYTDLFRMPQPTFNAYQPSQGMEAYVQMRLQTGKRCQLTMRYRFKTKQQNISGHAPLLEYNSTHTARIALAHTATKWNLHVATDACVVQKQTANPSLGWMVSLRSSQQWKKNISTALFAAAFFTDNYATRLYAYEPQLQYAAGFPTFAYHGLRTVAMVNWKPTPKLSLGLRYGLLHYFNRNSIGTGAQLIAAPSQNDISLQCRLTL